MDAPILRDISTRLETERLILRCPQPGDGAVVHDAIMESLVDLRAWPASLPWAMDERTVEKAEVFCRESLANFVRRTGFVYFAFERSSGRFVLTAGLHRIDWKIPKFEVGFWCRSSLHRQGFAREAVGALVGLARDTLGARRIDCITDEKNAASRALCERLGFALEGTLHHERVTPAGELRNTCVYAIVR
jgi:RimJ/RimL family protein N-acetyltransferase